MLAPLLQGQESQQKSVFSDPKPPEVFTVPADANIPAAKAFERLKYHAAPKALPEGAVTQDWKRFLGPNDDATTGETKLLATWPKSGPKVVWEMQKGTGYTSPVIAGGRLVYFHRIEDEEVIECLEPETGKRYWSFSYPVEYRDRYGYSNGPRASAVISEGKVYTLGVRSVLTCLDLKTGTKLWQRDLAAEFDIADYFFGHGSCPLVYDGKVIVSMGAANDLAMAAFDQHSGKLVWGSKHEWHASYSSPLVKTLRGKPRLLVLMGGDTKPPTGGLLCIDPDNGEVFDAFPWRADMYTSVNATTPVVVEKDQVYISECYVSGGVMVQLDENLKWKEVWKAPEFGMHWTTPVQQDGYLYAYRGRNEPDAWLACYEIASGKEMWQEDLLWQVDMGGRESKMKMLRGSILKADGRFYSLGELGSFGILDLSSKGVELKEVSQLFMARSTWSLPVVSQGLMYIVQHEPGQMGGAGRRVICYDLRAGE
ncbi:MAG: PQQ-like beta-propeller repeat protein [Verrucomicrobiales bacterium]|nr:PQQ-like beta-propeller repeat protein [Verrucomicrobiales bacterium]